MSDYTIITDFAAKDALITGNPLKIAKGTEVSAELTAIALAIATKANTASPTLVTPNIGVATGTSLVLSGSFSAAAFVGNLTGNVTGNVTGNADTATLASAASTVVSGATGVTPALGDNSTKLATTAFVNSTIAVPFFVRQFFPTF